MSILFIFVFNAHLPVLMALGNTGRNSNLQLQLWKLKTSHWIRRLAIFVNAISSFITKKQSRPETREFSPIWFLSHIWDFLLGVQPTGNPVFLGAKCSKYWPDASIQMPLKLPPSSWSWCFFIDEVHFPFGFDSFIVENWNQVYQRKSCNMQRNMCNSM